jgi:hypothetical protein
MYFFTNFAQFLQLNLKLITNIDYTIKHNNNNNEKNDDRNFDFFSHFLQDE